jgi:branched-subunit amino acid transport protein
MSDWVIIVGMAVVTYATRALPLLSRWKVSHPLAKRALCYAPPAVLAALVTPSLLAPGGAVEIGPKLWAGMLGAAVAWRTANLPLTVTIGLGLFGIMHWLGLG